MLQPGSLTGPTTMAPAPTIATYSSCLTSNRRPRAATMSGYVRKATCFIAYLLLGWQPCRESQHRHSQNKTRSTSWALFVAARAGMAEAELASTPTPGPRTAGRRADRATGIVARRAPWILRGMARLAQTTVADEQPSCRPGCPSFDMVNRWVARRTSTRPPTTSCAWSRLSAVQLGSGVGRCRR